MAVAHDASRGAARQDSVFDMEAGRQAVRGPVSADDGQAHARGDAQGRAVRLATDADAAIHGRRAVGAAPGDSRHRAVPIHPGADAAGQAGRRVR
ncbi:hypothetical protein G6F31_020545 [Rhizopus arrhizus]|nr:hypothetical protein G6F31_020545 [Rhizopus arrhizus]